jgi:hypothetical protein
VSQIFKSSSSGPSPPDVPTTFTTNSGNAVPAANILNVLGGSSTASNVNGITTTGSGNTLTVVLTNRLQGTGTSANGATSDLITFDLGGSAAVYRFKFEVTGRETTTGDGVGYTIFASAKTDGATATAIQTEFVDADEDASLNTANIDFITSGNDIILRFTGVALLTVDLSAFGTYVVV